MTAEAAIAGIAVVISLFSFVVNNRAAQSADRHGRMPVLIPGPGLEAGTVTVRNIGRGPAMNVVLARGQGELLTVDASRIALGRRRYRSSWEGHIHLHAIEAGRTRTYRYESGPVLGLSYTDALGHDYTLLSSVFGTKVVDRRAMAHASLDELGPPNHDLEPTTPPPSRED
jgi:hypothetical protein